MCLSLVKTKFTPPNPTVRRGWKVFLTAVGDTVWPMRILPETPDTTVPLDSEVV